MYSGEIAEMGEQLWYRLAARVLAGRGKWEARFARGIPVGKSEIDDTHLVVDLERGIQKCRDAPRHSVHTLETHTREKCTSLWTKHVHHRKDRKCSTRQGNHSAECRQRFEKIQYDLLQEKLRQAPVLPEDRGDQTVVTPAPAASSSSPSADERIQQKRAGLHGPEREPVQTSSPDVAMGGCG